MAFPRLDIVDTDETTVLWSFNDQLGTVNPNSVKAKLGPVDFGVRTEITTAEYLANGGQVSGYRDPVATATLTFYPAAATADARTTGLGVLNKLLERGGVMIWQPTSGSPLRYIDFLASPHVSVYQGQHVANLASVDEGVALAFLMQPYLRGALVTVGPTTVPDDPATSTKVRVLPITVTGDLPTPASVAVKMDTGATVERVLIAHRGPLTSAIAADYLSDTGFLQCEATGRGWTITLGTDTSTAVDTGASPGSGTSIAVVSFATNPTVMARRVRATRTTKLDSLRGDWDVWLRCELAGNNEEIGVQLRWGPSTADPVALAEPEVFHQTANITASGMFEKKLGRIHIPDTVALGGLALEVWAHHVGAGSADLEMDLLWLVPADNQGTVVVPSGSASTMLGKDMTTPPFKLTADPTWVAGAVVGNALKLNPANDAGGMGLNTGTDLPDGRNRVTFDVELASGISVGVVECRVVNVTDDAETVAASKNAAGRYTVTLDFDAVAAKLYQAQVNITGGGSASTAWIYSITHEFLPSLLNNGSLRTEPGPRYSVDRLDSSGNLAGYLGVEGEIPAELQPGVNHIMVRADEVPLLYYDENENDLARTPSVTVAYSPRYPL